MKEKDFYYASGWFSPEQESNYKEITTALKNAGLTLFEPRYDAGEMSDGPLTLERAKDMFSKDLEGINRCKGIFADISFRDTGVLVEVGYALGHNAAIQEKIDKVVDLAKGHFIDEDEFNDEYYHLKNELIDIVLFDNSTRPQMNIMLASAASNCIRNLTELQDWLNGEKVFDLGEGELR